MIYSFHSRGFVVCDKSFSSKDRALDFGKKLLCSYEDEVYIFRVISRGYSKGRLAHVCTLTLNDLRHEK